MTEKEMQLVLSQGAHRSFEAGYCAMELSAWLAGEKFSDHPECVSRVIGACMRSMNDNLPDDLRQALLPLTLEVIGTRTTFEDERTRGYMVADYAIRTLLPYMFRKLAKLRFSEEAEGWAAKLEQLTEIVDAESAKRAADLARSSREFAAQYRAIDSAIASAIDSAIDSAIASAIDSAIASAIDSAIAIAIAIASASASASAIAIASASAIDSAIASAAWRQRYAAAKKESLKELLPTWIAMVRRLIAVGKIEVPALPERAELVLAAAGSGQ